MTVKVNKDDIKLENIQSINIDSDDDGEDYITVNFTLPINGLHSIVDIEETYYLNNTPEYLNNAIKNLTLSIKKYIQDGTEQESLCKTCTSYCCRFFKEILLTKKDVNRISGGDKKFIKKHFDMYDRPDFRGYVGQVKRDNPNSTQDSACIFLKKNRCSIHEMKPQICKNFSEVNCSYYEADKKKKHEKRRLEVVV